MSNLAVSSPALILLSGLPGTGKTTFAHRLAEVLPFDHLESDAIRRSIWEQPAYTGAESAVVFARVEQLAARAVEGGRHVVVDATNVTNKNRRRFVRLADRAGATLVCVRVTAPEAVVRERLSRPREGWSQADASIYELMAGRPQPSREPVVVVDTRFSLEPAIGLVVRLIEGAER